MLNEKQVLVGLVHDLLQKGLVLFTIELAANALEKQSSRQVFDQAENRLAPPLSARLDGRLLATAGPGIAQPPFGRSRTRRHTGSEPSGVWLASKSEAGL